MRAVRALPEPHGVIPAVALTASGTSDDRARSLAAGFVAHLATPVDPATLVTTIASLCARD